MILTATTCFVVGARSLMFRPYAMIWSSLKGVVRFFGVIVISFCDVKQSELSRRFQGYESKSRHAVRMDPELKLVWSMFPKPGS